MAYLVSSVGLSKFKYPLEECNRFLQLKRYLRDQAGGTKLNFGLLSGIPAPRDLVPRRAVLRSVAWRAKQSNVESWSEVTGKDPYEYNNQVRDVVSTHFGWLVSQKAKALIETHEPDLHQFFPFEVLKRDGSLIERTFWLLNVCVRLDALAAECSTVYKVGPDLKKDPENWWYIYSRGKLRGSPRFDIVEVGLKETEPLRLSLNKSRIAGHAMWMDYRWGGVFVSDALGIQLQDAEIDGVALSPYPEV